MKTKLKYKGFLPIILSVLLIWIIAYFSFEILTNSFYQKKLFVTLTTLLFFIMTFLWLVLGEVKNKFIIVVFGEKTISVRRLGGLLPKLEFEISEIEGWKYSILLSSGGNHEYLYLYRNGKKIAKISEFYHQNYSEIKQYISIKFKDLGFEPFSYLAEFKEIFD